MTIKISEMSTSFSNANLVYVAIGMEVTDNASANTSKLMNLSVNGNSKFQVTKDGTLKIDTNFPPSSAFPILNIDNDSNSVVVITPNTSTFSQNTVVEKSTFVKSYAEGFKIVSAVGASLDRVDINLSEGSVFLIKSDYGTISTLRLIKPKVMIKDGVTEGRSYSCSLIVANNTLITTNFWNTANVKFGSNVFATTGVSTGSKYSIYTLMNFDIPSEPVLSNTWFGIVSGEFFEL